MWILFSCICGLPVLAVFGLWYYRRRSPYASNRSIEMDGAVCSLAEDGSVVIQPRTIRNWLYLIILIAFTVGISTLLGLTFQEILTGGSTWLDSIEALCFLIPLGVSFAGISIYLALSLRMQLVTFNKNSQMLVIGSGTVKLPFLVPSESGHI
ncbi:MAG: hypothetical protein FVQ83_13060 [Chloroflexi bacterium]|nr:hypothetical protein [Chloroflexota bacterium]